MSDEQGSVNPAFDKKANTGIKHFFNAMDYSAKGLRSAYKNESAFRQELGLLAFAIPTAVLLAPDWFQFAILISSIVFVMVIELLNSAVEAVVDKGGLEFHHLSGTAKDLGSAAVMMALFLAGILWIGVAADRFL